MSRTTKPRKRYRPKTVGRPIMANLRDRLVMPAYAALGVLVKSDDQDALRTARDSLAFLVMYMGKALPMSVAAVTGARALLDVTDRHARTGRTRCDGAELRALRAAVVWADEAIGTLRTDHLQDSLEWLDAALAARVGQ